MQKLNMKLTVEFFLEDMLVDGQYSFDSIRHHMEKIIVQIKRYPEQLAKPRLGYSCTDNGEGVIAARWMLSDER